MKPREIIAFSKILWNRLRIRTLGRGLRTQYGIVFPDFCLRAALSCRKFQKFRSSPVYQRVLEHVTKEHGEEYLKEIAKNSELLGQMEAFKRNDLYGGPPLSYYSGIGWVSPTTLRYVKVLADLTNFFGTLDGLKICEIGVGYGGQCRVINARFNPSSYLLIDLKPVLMLAQRYLDSYVLSSTTRYRTMNELESSKSDLVISNYAFSELPREIQEVYMRKVLLKSARGYLTVNDLAPPDFRSYKREELLETIPGSRAIAEIPSMDSRNYVLIWGE